MDPKRVSVALAEQLAKEQEKNRQLENELKHKNNVIRCIKSLLKIIFSIAGPQAVAAAKQQYQEEFLNQNPRN